MLKRKSVREKGKLSLSKLYADIKEGDKVALVRNHSYTRDFPERFHGKTGLVKGARGRSYVVEIYDGKRQKSLIVKRINLKKLYN